MKTFKTLMMAFVAVATMGLASCINTDNEYKGLTKEDIALCFATVKGNYEGDLIYRNVNEANIKDVYDTLRVAWNIDTDSTLTIAKFPSKLLAKNITNEQLKAALEAAPDQDLKCVIGFMGTSPVSYLMNPETLTYYLEYDGKKQKVQVVFTINSYASFGVYNTGKKILKMQIIEAVIYLNGNQTSYLKQVVPFILEAKRN
ncbi:MAG TPA: DUF4840 domain-containing protein [Prevotella sp.]